MAEESNAGEGLAAGVGRVGAAEQGCAAPAGAPPLFFKEEWKTVPGLPVEHPITQVVLSNQNLELKLYGVAGKDIQENGTEGDVFNPLHVWTVMLPRVPITWRSQTSGCGSRMNATVT